MTHGGAASLGRPVLLYTFVMAIKQCECGMIMCIMCINKQLMKKQFSHQVDHSKAGAKNVYGGI